MTDRVLSQVLEVDLDRCTNTYGVNNGVTSFCTATGAPGSECYQGFRTCQDKPNFVRGTQTLKFIKRGQPIANSGTHYPYIDSIERAITRVDPEEGLAQRASTTIKMVDATDSDVDLDPYIATRAAVASGTFWTRFLARHRNYIGRVARIVQAMHDGSTLGTTVTEKYIIDSIKGPDSKGFVTVVLKDPGKLLDKSKAPTPTNGKLLAVLAAGALSFSVESGRGAQYDASGWIRIDDEVMAYTRVGDAFTIPTTGRANFGTADEEHRVGALVQQCLVFSNATIYTVIKTLYNFAGIPDADLDLVNLQAEVNTWLFDFTVNAVISSPEGIDKLVKELCQQCHLMAWWSVTEQKHKFKVYAPQAPSTLPAPLTATYDLMEESVETDRLDNLRITLSAIYYAIRAATLSLREAKNYGVAEVAIDADAESDEEYGDRIPHTQYSRWFDLESEQALRASVQRRLGRYRDAPEQIKKFSLDPSYSLQEGDLRDLQAPNFTNADGTTKTVRVLVTSRKDEGTHVEYSARVTTFDRRYGFIAPAGTSNYPNNNGYACVSSAAGRMNDGTDGYLII